MAKSDASGSTFHRPLNIDMMWQNKKKVSNNDCKLCVSASRSTMYFFEPVETFLVKLTILLTFRLSKNC